MIQPIPEHDKNQSRLDDCYSAAHYNDGKPLEEYELLYKEYGIDLDVEERYDEAVKYAEGLPDYISKESSKKAMKLLRDNNLLPSLEKELSKWVTGEYETKKGLLLTFGQAYVSNPHMKIHVLVNSESSAGKSYVVKKCLSIFPQRRWEYFTRITPRALDYWPPKKLVADGFTWDNMILALEDVDAEVLDSGSIKVWMSEGQKTLLLQSQNAILRETPGTPNIVMTFAEPNPKSELLSRCLVLRLDESKDQTQSIISHLVKKYLGREDKQYNTDIMDAISSLKNVPVIVPYADKLEFAVFPTDNIRIRRYFSLFMELIKSCAALNQYCRKTDDNGNILTDGYDYEQARSVLHYIFQSENIEPLTHKQRKCFDACIQMNDIILAEKLESEGWWTAADLYNKFSSIASQKMWYIYLAQLTESKYLEAKIVKQEGISKPTRFYKAKPYGEFQLPKFTILQL